MANKISCNNCGKTETDYSQNVFITISDKGESQTYCFHCMLERKNQREEAISYQQGLVKSKEKEIQDGIKR